MLTRETGPNLKNDTHNASLLMNETIERNNSSKIETVETKIAN